MPIIQLSKPDDIDTTLLEVIAHSFFPGLNEASTREQWVNKALRQHAREWTSKLSPLPQYPDTFRRWMEQHYFGKGGDDIRGLKENEDRDIKLAARLLANCTLYKMSRAKAKSEIADDYLRGTNKKVEMNSALAKIKRAWAHYSTGVHYIAAWSLMHTWDVSEDVEINDFRSLTIIAFGEYLRVSGETTIPSGAQTPILDSRTTWKMPDGYPLPEVKVLTNGKLQSNFTRLYAVPTAQ